MAGFDDPPSTTPETSTVVAEPDIPSEETTTEPTTTTEVTTTTEATTTQETTIEPTTTEATTTEPTTTEETTIEPTTTEETTIEPTTTEATTTEETTIEPTTTEETTIEPTTTEETTIQPTTTEATTTEEMTIEPATTEATTTEETTVEPTTTEATTTEETTIEPTTTVETTIEPTTTEATTIQETTIEPTTTEAMTTEETTIEPTRTEATMMEKTTTETITTAATATEEITIESTMTEATTTEETTIEPTTTEATTTEETIHQISTTPLSANITTETSIPFIPEKKEPPSIAVGIDSSVFDFAVPLVHEDKTVLTTATESTQVISTTTPLMTTTTHEEVTTVEVTSTTEAAVVPKPILERPVAPPAPDHPPPIIFVPQPKGRIPEVPAYHGFQPIIYHQKPVGTTTTAPPPPIFIPEMPRIIPSRPRFQSPFQPQPVRKPVSDTAVPGFKYKEPPGQGRHHMSIIELTRLAFEQINRALTPARRSYTGPQYSTGTGLQQFFRPAVPMTRRPTTTTATTTTTQQFVNKFKLPADRSLTESKPWQSTAENTWTGLKFDLPAGSNVWGAGGLWPSLSQPIKPIQLPRVDAQTLKPGPSESFFPYSEPAKPPQKQLFNMPKGDASSNIWGSNDLWGHIQGTATTTARPEFQARPIVQNEFDKGKSVWTKPLMPQQLSEHKVDPLFKPPTYGIFGQQESANKRGTKVDVKPIPNTNQLFKMPGLWNLMTQKQSPPDRSSDVKSVWQAPTAVPIRPILVSDHTRNKTKQTVKSVIDTHPLKDLRASQHDIRFYNKPQSHQLYKPSINLVQDNMADLFLKASLAGSRSSLAGSRSRKTHLNPSRERFRNRSLQRKPVPSITTATTKKPLEFQQRPIYKQEHKTTPYIHKTTLYKHKPTPYKHRTTPYEQKIHAHEVKPIGEKHRTSPLTFEELLLRQLQGDASLFDMRRWGPKHLEKTSTTKTDSRRPGHIEEKPKSVSEIQKQQLPSATTIATYTERQTTQRVQRGSTPAPIAAEHPPPIFDSKVFRTFMPFPKDQPSSKESGRSGTKNLRGTSDIKPFGDPNEVKHGMY